MSKKELHNLEFIYKSYYKSLHYYCLQFVKNTEDAQEIVNDSFIAVWEKRAELNFEIGIKPYLFRTVHNKSLNFLKKKKLPIQDLDTHFIHTSTADYSPIEILSSKELEKKVHALIQTLPPRCKQVFLLSRIENFTHKEISAIMDISTKTIENQITIALKHIRKGIEDEPNEPLKLQIILLLIAPHLENAWGSLGG